jgi:hypothetical protein
MKKKANFKNPKLTKKWSKHLLKCLDHLIKTKRKCIITNQILELFQMEGRY